MPSAQAPGYARVAERLSRSFLSVTGLIVAIYAVAESSDSAAASAGVIALLAVGTVVTIRCLGIDRRSGRRAAGLLAAVGALAVLGSGADVDVLIAPAYVSALAFSLLAVVMILRHIMRATAVDDEVVFAALTVYLLIGICFGTVFTALARYDPTMFEPAQELASDETSSLYYFSFVTLTTVGFGDVVPATGPTRMLTVLEALVGQIVLVTLVARLVGMQVGGAATSGAIPPDGRGSRPPAR